MRVRKVTLGMLMMAAGCWVRYVGSLHHRLFWVSAKESARCVRSSNAACARQVAFAGQAICACAQPFVVTVMTMISMNWFSESERGFATTASAFTNILGSGVAFGVCVFWRALLAGVA